MSDTMLAAFFSTPGHVEVREVERPLPGPGEVLVRITASGICGSDVAAWRGIEQEWHRRGHEYAGVVETVGDGVEGFAPGQAVAGYGSLPCGVCTHCRRGRPKYCLQPRSSGGGAFAEYLCLPCEFWFPLEGLSAEEGALLEPLTVALEMVRDGRVTLGNRVLLLGAGPIGLMALSICKALGALVYMVHPRSSAKRWALAEAWGADAALDATVGDVEKRVRELVPGGVDTVLITTMPTVGVPLAAACATRGGVLSLIGMQWEAAHFVLEIDRFHFANLQLVGSNHNPCALYYAEAAELLRRRIIRGDELISHRFPLAEIEAAFKTTSEKRAEVAKVMITG